MQSLFVHAFAYGEVFCGADSQEDGGGTERHAAAGLSWGLAAGGQRTAGGIKIHLQAPCCEAADAGATARVPVGMGVKLQ